MAQCVRCKTNVGCGCNLNKDGLCAYCAQQKKDELTVKPLIQQ